MKKIILTFMIGILSFVSFSDTYMEDHIEDMLERKYNWISDGSNHIELDFDVHEDRNSLSVIVSVDDDSYPAKKSFKESTFNNYVKEIEKTVKNEVKDKNVTIKSYF